MLNAHGVALGHTVFLHDHGIGALRNGGTRENAGSFAGVQRLAMRARRNALRHFQNGPRCAHVGAANGIAIHGTVVLRRHLQGRQQILCQHTPIAFKGGHFVHARQGLGTCQQQWQGFVQGQQWRSAHRNSGAE